MRHLILALALAATPVAAQEITVEEIATLPEADVVFLGELHDNPWHHENQAAAVRALAPKAVVFEMLTAEAAAQVTPALIADKPALDAALGWAESGWPSFDMYYPIFAAAQGAAIYGALVPREAARDAIMGGDVVAAFGEGADIYGLAAPLGEAEQAEREAGQMAAHCDALPESLLPGMVLAQRLRDATMAREIVRAHDETGGPVVVITGNGHARTDWGAPRLLPDHLSVRSIGQLERTPDETPPHDAWIVTPQAEREDPCAGFKTQ
ncbi:MAG: ChaN family lipoprotein [Pseudopelagicola sp.]|nr:ChaN family lipoprotein [Pseudopelagicola sp.]